MAKAKKPLPAPPRPPILKAVLLVLACALAGGAIVYKYGPALRKAAREAHEQGLGRPAPAGAGKEGAGLKPALPDLARSEAVPDAKLAKLNRVELEREVRRLREEIDLRDRENSELKIQLKILRDGSRSER